MLSASTRSATSRVPRLSRFLIAALAMMGILVGLVSTHVVLDRASHSMPAIAATTVAQVQPAGNAAAPTAGPAEDAVASIPAPSCDELCELACVAVGLAVIFMLAVHFLLRGPAITFSAADVARVLQTIGRVVQTTISARAPSLTALSISRT